MIERPMYLKKLMSLQNNGRVKIITGIRRCGKSYLLKELFSKYLFENKVKKDHYIYIALDDISNIELYNPLILDKYVRSLIKDADRYYVVIDEIQNVFNIVNPALTEGKIVKAKSLEDDTIGFVQVVLGLMKIENIDLYITGSNSRFLSKDILTDFRDRGDEIHVSPLSFKEYLQARNIDKETAYEEYSLYGGMPRTLEYDDESLKEKYITDLYKLVYIKDVLERQDKTKAEELNTLIRVMASNVSSLINPNIIANTFKSKEKKSISAQTIYSYLDELENIFLISKVFRFDIRKRKNIGATYKYYFSDIGIRNAILDFLHQDKDHIMGNIIYNELINRGYSVEIGILETFSKDKNNKTIRVNYETDFVAKIGSKVYYIQAAYDIANEEKYEQEAKSLTLINDSFKKIIVTRKSGPITHDINGITTIGVIDFLLDENSLDK